jgi:signal transduction histidine kinase
VRDKRNDQGGPAGEPAHLADRLTARIPELITCYRDRLLAISSPLACDTAAWEQCERQARRILGDCARTLARGSVTVTETHISEVLDLGGERVRQGVHLTHSVRAGMILSDLALTALEECAAGTDTPYPLLVQAVRALQNGVGLRLESGSIGYDSFLLHRVREIHDEDHRRLARDIHDQIGNALSLAVRKLELYEVECERAAGGVSPHVRQSKDALLEAIGRSRELVTELRRPAVTGSLETALKGFAASLGESGAPVRLWVRGLDEWMPASVAEELFIMVRECLRNAWTHAAAPHIVVHIDIAPHEIQAEVIDDGTGFDLQAVRAGGRTNGLLSLQERAALVGGTLNIDSAPGRGTRVTVWIPIPEEHQTA